MPPELWTCPQCGRQFANTNQWHSCLDLDAEQHLEGHTRLAVELYRLFQAAVEDCGEFRIHAQKTRIAFINRMTFAGVSLAKGWIDVSFITPAVVDDPRIRSIEMYGPTSFANIVRISDGDELDRDVRNWLCQAWRRGTQESLDSGASVDRVTGPAREVLTVPLATSVHRNGEELVVRLPRYAADALGEGSRVDARVPRADPQEAVVREGSLHFHTDFLRRRGLGDGDELDISITPS